ncbi:MAG: flavodoxin family protein [Gemmatimonadota bacterium]|nr:flavodoxin family protein [Gemmatimonadota bacterium]
MPGQIILALSGSPNPKSFTHRVLETFLEPVKDSAEINLFVPREMEIGPCLGCFHCWRKKTSGQCVQKDDFEQIIEAYKVCDTIILAAPLYIFGFPATLKNVLDRFFITLEPDQLPTGDGKGTRHPIRWHRERKALLISTCGFPEPGNFELLQEHFRTICNHTRWEQAGEVLLPAAGAFNGTPLAESKTGQIRAAGREFLETGLVSGETRAKIAEAPFTHEQYRKIATWNFKGGLMNKAKTIALMTKIMGRAKIMSKQETDEKE